MSDQKGVRKKFLTALIKRADMYIASNKQVKAQGSQCTVCLPVIMLSGWGRLQEYWMYCTSRLFLLCWSFFSGTRVAIASEILAIASKAVCPMFTVIDQCQN